MATTARTRVHRLRVPNVSEIDIDQATRAMFNYDLEGCAPMLFGQTVQRAEYQAALPAR